MKNYKLRKFLIMKTGIIIGTNSKGELWYEIRVAGKLKHWSFIVQEMPAWVEEFELQEEIAHYNKLRSVNQ